MAFARQHKSPERWRHRNSNHSGGNYDEGLIVVVLEVNLLDLVAWLK